MSLLLIGLGLASLALPGLRPSLSLRGDPRWFAPLDAMALVLGATAAVAGLGLSGVVGALHMATGGRLAQYAGHLAPGGWPVWVASGILLAMIVSRLAQVGVRASRAAALARAEAWVGRHYAFSDHEVVVLPTSELVAYSVGGWPPQVVVSEGLQARLGRDMAAFVVEHERAHLRRRDRRFLVVSAMVEGAFGHLPAIRRGTLALALAVERGADEAAAGPDRYRRRWLAEAMRDLAGSSHSIPVEAITYRAAGLGSSPPRASVPEMLAVAGLICLTLAIVVAGGHIGTHVPAVLASVR